MKYIANDCISREAVDRIINKWLSHPDYELKDHIYSMTEKIHNLPSVTPQEPKTGHWILDETDNSITCDRCGCLIWANDISNGEAYYCPNCGADMRGNTKRKGEPIEDNNESYNCENWIP